MYSCRAKSVFLSQKLPDAQFFRLEDCSLFTRIPAGHVARQHDGKLQCVGHKIRGAEKKVKNMDGYGWFNHVTSCFYAENHEIS